MTYVAVLIGKRPPHAVQPSAQSTALPVIVASTRAAGHP